MYVPICLIFVNYKYRKSGIEKGCFYLIIVRLISVFFTKTKIKLRYK